MSIIAKIDTPGFSGHLHDPTEHSPSDFHHWHHPNTDDNASIDVDVQETGVIVVGCETRGAHGWRFYTRDQAADLRDQLTAALNAGPKDEETEETEEPCGHKPPNSGKATLKTVGPDIPA